MIEMPIEKQTPTQDLTDEQTQQLLMVVRQYMQSAEVEQVAQPITLDMDEVDVVDIDGIRLLNECQTQGIQVVNCSPYIREWMLQEKRTGEDEE